MGAANIQPKILAWSLGLSQVCPGLLLKDLGWSLDS
jgi:hypothetical protein